MVHHSSCPNCKSASIKTRYQLSDHFVSGEQFNILRCDDCEFIFTQDHPDENKLGKYYQSEEYISHSNTSTGMINRIYHSVRDLMLQRKYRMVVRGTQKNKGTLIDIGCGTGYFPAYMKKKDWEVKGLEINEKAREFAFDTFGLEISEPAFIEKLDDKSFDCVTMWHVLEHFHNPSYYLNEAHRILSDDGVIIIALPNNNSFDAVYYKEYWAAWDVPRHLWHFKPLVINSYIKKYGLQLRRIHRLPFDSFYVSILSEKYKNAGLATLKGLIIGFFSWFISVFNKRRCSSLVYIIDKIED